MSAAVIEEILDEFTENVPFRQRPPIQEYTGHVRQYTDTSQMSS